MLRLPQKDENIREKKEIRIVGIDPGSVGLGICLLENGTYKGSVQIDVQKETDNFYERLRDIREKVDLALANFGPADYYALEMPWVGFNANVAIKLGQVRGMIVGEILFLNPNAKIIDITPMQIRAFLNIERKCKKEVMQEEINKMFQGQLTDVIALGKNQDEIDSIGVAIAAYNKLMINNLGVRSNENICIN